VLRPDRIAGGAYPEVIDDLVASLTLELIAMAASVGW
jgi:hypothetical protein